MTASRKLIYWLAEDSALRNCLLDRVFMKIACFLAVVLLAAGSVIEAACGAETGSELIAFDALDYGKGAVTNANAGVGWQAGWRVSRISPPSITQFPGATDDARAKHGAMFRGTGDRNNPLRRKLSKAVTDGELFIRFELHYRQPEESRVNGTQFDPEFFVFWLDRLEGTDRSTHSANVPNIGLHLADRGPQKGKNVFMVRIGSANAAWSNVELQYGRTYQIVGRLSKTKGKSRTGFERFDLWVDPELSDLGTPDATISGAQSINAVEWIGASTGRKTEASDQILVRNLLLGNTWQSVLETSVAAPASVPRGHNGIVWEIPVDFKRDVYPLLQSRCFECHSGEQPDSGFRLDVHREWLGYSTGEILAAPGRSHQSRLVEVLAADSEENRMPPAREDPLTDQQIAMLIAWVDQGMKWDETLLPTPKRKSDHWAFQPIVKPSLPHARDNQWIRTPVDAFVTRQHQRRGLSHADEASRATLVRRLYLDLIGIPPTSDELNHALNDDSPQAYERLVERLLDSPHYGERFARYWLDLARWAESQGYQHDIVRPFAWRYRDYVIDAFNSDKPYDRFLKEQLAGDELQPYSDENLIATGFLGAARISGNQGDEAIQRNDVMVDIVNATGSAMLGLTLECAQCHNHKIDPISQRDYYRLQAFFVRGQLGNLALQSPSVDNPVDLGRWIPKPAFAFYNKEVKTLQKRKMYSTPTRPHTWGFLSAATGDASIERFPVVNRKPIKWQPDALKHARAKMLIRGDAGNPGNEVQPGWPEVLGVTPTSLGSNPRTALAEWMSDPRNPLVARVWVNRLWQYHFGRGIVATESDFGVQGAEPSHPGLLDWLASELIENGWSTKSIHRVIVLSSTYRQQRKFRAEDAAIDPTNQYLWNWPRRRLSAEAIRDSVLVATGELERNVGGVSIPPEREESELRRTIYLFQQRSDMPSVMAMFDAPQGIASCSRRAVSTVALQPLFMLNSQFMARRAESLARVVANESGDDVGKQIEFAFRRTICRMPDEHEQLLAKRILQSTDESDEHLRLTQFCHALLNLNEFIYIP